MTYAVRPRACVRTAAAFLGVVMATGASGQFFAVKKRLLYGKRERPNNDFSAYNGYIILLAHTHTHTHTHTRT